MEDVASEDASALDTTILLQPPKTFMAKGSGARVTKPSASPQGRGSPPGWFQLTGKTPHHVTSILRSWRQGCPAKDPYITSKSNTFKVECQQPGGQLKLLTSSSAVGPAGHFVAVTLLHDSPLAAAAGGYLPATAMLRLSTRRRLHPKAAQEDYAAADGNTGGGEDANMGDEAEDAAGAAAEGATADGDDAEPIGGDVGGAEAAAAAEEGSEEGEEGVEAAAAVEERGGQGVEAAPAVEEGGEEGEEGEVHGDEGGQVQQQQKTGGEDDEAGHQRLGFQVECLEAWTAADVNRKPLYRRGYELHCSADGATQLLVIQLEVKDKAQVRRRRLCVTNSKPKPKRTRSSAPAPAGPPRQIPAGPPRRSSNRVNNHAAASGAAAADGGGGARSQQQTGNTGATEKGKGRAPGQQTSTPANRGAVAGANKNAGAAARAPSQVPPVKRQPGTKVAAANAPAAAAAAAAAQESTDIMKVSAAAKAHNEIPASRPTPAAAVKREPTGPTATAAAAANASAAVGAAAAAAAAPARAGDRNPSPLCSRGVAAMPSSSARFYDAGGSSGSSGAGPAAVGDTPAAIAAQPPAGGETRGRSKDSDDPRRQVLTNAARPVARRSRSRDGYHSETATICVKLEPVDEAAAGVTGVAAEAAVRRGAVSPPTALAAVTAVSATAAPAAVKAPVMRDAAAGAAAATKAGRPKAAGDGESEQEERKKRKFEGRTPGGAGAGAVEGAGQAGGGAAADRRAAACEGDYENLAMEVPEPWSKKGRTSPAATEKGKGRAPGQQTSTPANRGAVAGANKNVGAAARAPSQVPPVKRQPGAKVAAANAPAAAAAAAAAQKPVEVSAAAEAHNEGPASRAAPATAVAAAVKREPEDPTATAAAAANASAAAGAAAAAAAAPACAGDRNPSPLRSRGVAAMPSSSARFYDAGGSGVSSGAGPAAVGDTPVGFHSETAIIRVKLEPVDEAAAGVAAEAAVWRGASASAAPAAVKAGLASAAPAAVKAGPTIGATAAVPVTSGPMRKATLAAAAAALPAAGAGAREIGKAGGVGSVQDAAYKTAPAYRQLATKSPRQVQTSDTARPSLSGDAPAGVGATSVKSPVMRDAAAGADATTKAGRPKAAGDGEREQEERKKHKFEERTPGGAGAGAVEGAGQAGGGAAANWLAAARREWEDAALAVTVFRSKKGRTASVRRCM